MQRTVMRVSSLILLVVAGFLLLVPHVALAGWLTWAAGLLCLLGTTRSFAKHLVLIYGSVAVLGLIPINTSITPAHIALMGSALSLTIVVPYVVMRYIYKEDTIKYTLFHGRWHWWHFGYILLTALLGYLLLPFWMQSTGHYANWSVDTDPGSLFVLFLGTNGLGIWDELFFVITTLAILRKHIPFWAANLIQAVLWTAFLFDLGFQGWIFPLLFVFALLQGIVFSRTHSLVYILAIHLTLDFVLYLALINAHHANLVNIFITR